MLSLHFFKSKAFFTICIGFGVATYVASMLLVKLDSTFTYRWIAFGLSLSSVISICILYVIKHIKSTHFSKETFAKEVDPVLGLFILALTVNMFFLATYPYISISDELRDGGLNALQIASGTLKNIWGYGSYGAHGLIIPTITSFFYLLFGSSVLTFRLPAALLSSLDIVFLYLLVRNLFNRSTAFWASLILVSFPLHIFFAHTQVVVAFNFFFASVLLYFFYRLLKSHATIDYIFFGTVVGFVCNFHAAIRSFACVLLLILFFLEGKKLIEKHFASIKQHSLQLLFLLLFAVIGFGPRLLYTAPQDFLHTSRFSLEDKVTAHKPFTLKDATTIKTNYVKSLMVYVYETTSFFYPEPIPLLPPFLAIFFMLGLGYGFFVVKDRFVNILLFLLLTIPFINSAMTDAVNAEHRLSPLLPVVATITAIGIAYIFQLLKWKGWKYLFGFILLCYLTTQVVTYYTSNVANKGTSFQDIVTMDTFTFLQSDTLLYKSPMLNLSYANKTFIPTPLCLYMSPKNFQYFPGNIRIDEPEEYFIPSATIQYQQNSAISDNDIYVLHQPCVPDIPYTRLVTQQTSLSCLDFNHFMCPLGKKDIISIHY